jgi:hypothetical protein
VLNAAGLLDVLTRQAGTLESRLGPAWTEFSRRSGELAGRFQAIAGEDDPHTAAASLKRATREMLRICRDYPAVVELLDQARGALPDPDLVGGGILRPPAPGRPGTPDEVEVKEIANRFYSLLARMRDMSVPARPDAAPDREERPRP